MRYNPNKIEKKWQRVWAKNNYKIWHVADNSKKKHIYILDMFPYPSGEGLHVGHVEGYTASDILARYYRMKGYEVLHPMGWDAFGLPAENYALKTKKPPQEVVSKNIKKFKQQLQSLGFSYDWQREINTTDPYYYKWTQWIFLQLFKKGLAYESESIVNWCPSCKTVLANEEVVDGKCERCGTEVERKKLKQWVLKITAFADRLLHDLCLLDWPDRVKTMQKNWIGRSTGIDVQFKVEGKDEHITVFTTRIDTIFGVSYLVIAPEHLLINKLVSPDNRKEVKEYIEKASQKSDFERQSEVKNKSGVFLGTYAINPANQERVPIWVSDYVLASYGTGVVMGVPAHDQRDFEFAQQFHLPIKEVISPDGNIHNDLGQSYSGEGVLINSGPFNGRLSSQSREKITLFVDGKKKVRYRLRDWIFSRQRYWGEPIPIVKCPRCGNVALPENKLPLQLPKISKYEPTGENESPLADISWWVNTKCPRCGGLAKREVNTMPQWAGSCWYYLAFLLGVKKLKLKNLNLGNAQFKKIFDNWLPVNVYIGGVEHAVLHLLYARFWYKFLFDLGIVSTPEPFYHLINQGVILGEDGEKMSKSRGNIISPDTAVKKYGADSLRMYEMFMGPLSFSKPWNTQGVTGIYRFLNKVWTLVTQEDKAKKKKIKLTLTSEVRKKLKGNMEELERTTHKTIKKVTEDVEELHFNTAISALMKYVNDLSQVPFSLVPKKYLDTLVLLLSPFAPHLSEELWHEYLHHRKLASQEKWPSFKAHLTEEKSFSLIIQINGKTRAKVKVKNGISKEEAQSKAASIPQVKKYLQKKAKRVVFVKDRLINFVQ